MDKRLAMLKIYPDAQFNPACFNFTEEEARTKKLWRDPRPMPTQESLEAAHASALEEEELKKQDIQTIKAKLKGKDTSIEDKLDVLITFLGIE